MTLVSDGHTTEDMREWGSPIGVDDAIAYTNLYWSFTRTPDAKGQVVAADEVDFSAPGGVAQAPEGAEAAENPER